MRGKNSTAYGCECSRIVSEVVILHEAGSGLPGTGGGCQVGRAFARQRLGSVVAGETSERLDPSASCLPS